MWWQVFMSDVNEPQPYEEDAKKNLLEKAMDSEISSLKENDTWTLKTFQDKAKPFIANGCFELRKIYRPSHTQVIKFVIVTKDVSTISFSFQKLKKPADATCG